MANRDRPGYRPVNTVLATKGSLSLNGQLLIGTATITSTVVIHVFGIICLIAWMRKQETWIKQAHPYVRITITLISTIIGLFVMHTIEIWLWAALYMYLGEFKEFGRALYFSTVTFTTLGYGDVTLSEKYRLLGSLEAVNGIILFGVSTAIAFAALRRALGLAGLVTPQDTSPD